MIIKQQETSLFGAFVMGGVAGRDEAHGGSRLQLMLRVSMLSRRRQSSICWGGRPNPNPNIGLDRRKSPDEVVSDISCVTYKHACVAHVCMCAHQKCYNCRQAKG